MTEIYYLDRDLLVSVKPRGILSEGEGNNCFPSLLQSALREKGEKDPVYPVHRLDKETEGLMVYARTPSAAASLSRAITEGSLKKQYLAVVCGEPKEKSGTLRDLLFYDRRLGKSFVVDRARKGVKEAILDYETLATKEGYSLLRVTLHTGRTHQIRVQFASRSLPLAGDRRYGAPPSPYFLGLSATRLSFPHPKDGKVLTFTYLPNSRADETRANPFELFAEELKN
ncbi:MAG: RNA pseudouridine synthase [Clostridia bacterium]|nr:RNA pseudouridine synthase [Clostridia bacterium]